MEGRVSILHTQYRYEAACGSTPYAALHICYLALSMVKLAAALGQNLENKYSVEHDFLTFISFNMAWFQT